MDSLILDAQKIRQPNTLHTGTGSLNKFGVRLYTDTVSL
jgi:hypothetical protein